MTSGGHCKECGRLIGLYLGSVNRHTKLVEELAALQDGHDPGDINWLIKQTEWRVQEARKTFLAHRASHHRK